MYSLGPSVRAAPVVAPYSEIDTISITIPLQLQYTYVDGRGLLSQGGAKQQQQQQTNKLKLQNMSTKNYKNTIAM